MHIDEIIEERCFGSSNKTVYVCWTSRPIWAWEGQLGLAVTMQDAGVSAAGVRPREALNILRFGHCLTPKAVIPLQNS